MSYYFLVQDPRRDPRNISFEKCNRKEMSESKLKVYCENTLINKLAFRETRHSTENYPYYECTYKLEIPKEEIKVFTDKNFAIAQAKKTSSIIFKITEPAKVKKTTLVNAEISFNSKTKCDSAIFPESSDMLPTSSNSKTVKMDTTILNLLTPTFKNRDEINKKPNNGLSLLGLIFFLGGMCFIGLAGTGAEAMGLFGMLIMGTGAMAFAASLVPQPTNNESTLVSYFGNKDRKATNASRRTPKKMSNAHSNKHEQKDTQNPTKKRADKHNVADDHTIQESEAFLQNFDTTGRQPKQTQPSGSKSSQPSMQRPR